MDLLTAEELKLSCPVKWHSRIPTGGVSLGVADVDFAGPRGIVEYLREKLTDDFSFYQHHNGLPSTISTIVDYMNRLNIPAKENNIQITPGTMMGIYAGMKYASRRDGRIVYAGPLYEPIHRHGKDLNNEIDFVAIEMDGLNHEALISAVDENTKMIAINNPSNPNGYVYSRDDINLIRDLVVERDIVCFVDELYQPLIFDRSKNKHISPASVDGLSERTIALYGFSKAYGLAGFRSGFMYVGDMLEEELHYIIESQMVSPSPVSSLVAEWALTSEASLSWVEDFRKEMESRTRFATELFIDAGYSCQLPDACFFIYPDIEKDDIEFSESLLKNRGVQVIPGVYFGPTGKNHLRINVATSEDRLRDGIERILAELND